MLKNIRLPINQENSINEHFEKINKPEIVKFINTQRSFILELESPMSTFYTHYSNSRSLMSFDQFFDFYKDFSLFPDIVNLITLKKIFFTLAEVLGNLENDETSMSKSFISFEKDNLNTGKANYNFINFNLFLQSLAISAMFFKFNENFRDIDKCIYLVERINQSKGLQKCQMKNSKT